MKTEQMIVEIAQLSLSPIMERLSERANKEVEENFCKPRCGHGPEGSFCLDACVTYKRLVRRLFEEYASLN